MGSNRRKFLKITGLGSLGLFGTGKLTDLSSKNENKSKADRISRLGGKGYVQQFNMHDYAAPALEVVRVGVTGVGNRGSGTVRRLASLEGVEVVAINDLEQDRV